MATTIQGRDWTLSVEQEWIDVTSSFATPDEKWRFTDANGHEHFYESGYPTLDYVIDAQHFCVGNEGMGPHDPHWAVDEAHYECLVCREVVEPRFDPPHTPKFIPGMRTATLHGTRTDGMEVTVSLRGEDVDLLAAAIEHSDARAELHATDLLDNAPPERVLTWQVRFPR